MQPLSIYLHEIEKAFAAGNATEHTHRPALKSLLESLGAGIVATNEPKRIQCGAPDFILTQGQTPLRVAESFISRNRQAIKPCCWTTSQGCEDTVSETNL